MAKKSSTLSVQADGKRRFISVPSARAHDLHAYLRSHRVHSSPPEPAYTGFDYIELDRDINIDNVQALLDVWK